MATKEDILEQLVEEYLISKGYFVRHNIKYRPHNNHPDFVKIQDSNHSDIDVLGYHPTLDGPSKVCAISCKSWQGGFDPSAELRCIKEKKIIRGKEAWKGFRELTKAKWSEAFIDAIYEATNCHTFTYILAVAHLKSDRTIWENDPEFLNAMSGHPIRIITFKEIVREIYSEIGTTLAATEIGRILQMFKASGIVIDNA